MSPSADAIARAESRDQALRLEYFTVIWTLIEALVGITAAVLASSVALFGFGIDSVIECASACILIWRFAAERRARSHAAIERLDQRAHKLVALSLFGLSAYILIDAGWTLWQGDRPHPTFVGVVLTTVTMGVMYWLVRAKRRAATALASRALAADSFQATACLSLSLITLVGVGLNALFGWWWADPAAAICMPVFLVQEGRQAWRGEDCCSPR